jgi:deazaflavin-dependent oxidoreductase (nitroreductase family)
MSTILTPARGPGMLRRKSGSLMPFPRAITRYTRGLANQVALNFVGHAAFADLEHVGRRSGTVRHTPLRAFRTRDQVVIGLNFGRESDWFRNVRAAGRCRMRLGNDQLELGAPRLVALAEGIEGMPWYFGLALRGVVRTRDCVELPVISSTRIDGPTSPLPRLALVIVSAAAAAIAVRLLRYPSGCSRGNRPSDCRVRVNQDPDRGQPT